MPYLEPEHVLQQFAGYLSDDVREALADEEKYVEAQVGSMSSSLNFLGRELSGMHVALNTQRRRLQDALDETEAELGDDESSAAVKEAIASARADLAQADENDARSLEQDVTAAASSVFCTINQELDGEVANQARRPLYDFLETRVQTQLDILGRE